MSTDEFDLPNEFARFENFVKEDFERFFQVFKKYEDMDYTFFQSFVNASDDLANSHQIEESLKAIYTQIAMTGYFLLSQYKKVLTFPIQDDDFELLYFRLKSAALTGEKSIVSALLASSLAMLVDLKKSNPSAHRVFHTIMSLETAAINSDVPSVQKFARKFKDMLFDSVLIQEFPLLTLQVVSDLAYREFRSGDAAYEGSIARIT